MEGLPRPGERGEYVGNCVSEELCFVKGTDKAPDFSDCRLLCEGDFLKDAECDYIVSFARLRVVVFFFFLGCDAGVAIAGWGVFGDLS